jgi:hypothetical protein
MHPYVARGRSARRVPRGKDSRQVRLGDEGSIADGDLKERHVIELRQSSSAGGACYEAARVDQPAPLAVTVGNDGEDS